MTMGKMANKNVLSNQQLVSPNLELVSPTRQLNRNKVEKRIKNNSSSPTSLTIFKYLILSTAIIFSFGGLGFGLALRYGDNYDISRFQNITDNN